MNERIRELEKQCWETRQVTNDAHSWHTSFNTQKFAELLIRECIFAVEDAGGIDKYHYTKAISRHFGVEE